MSRVSKKKRMRHLRFDPQCRFEVAKAIRNAMKDFYGRQDFLTILSWVADDRGHSDTAEKLRAAR